MTNDTFFQVHRSKTPEQGWFAPVRQFNTWDEANRYCEFVAPMYEDNYFAIMVNTEYGITIDTVYNPHIINRK
tara:strand:- start:342 stop:560 length:219 start_codon:yes stop_codon:yes gene_type:complete